MDDGLRPFLATALRLKTLKRAGWVRCGVGDCESVAEHSFGVALLALVASDAQLNRERCIELAMVHDLAESIVGDLTPADAVSPQEKFERELEAMQRLSKLLGDERILALWEEFESAATVEAQFVRDLDVIEMAWQANEYEATKMLKASDAKGFRDSARSRLRTNAGRALFAKIIGDRDNHW